MAQYLDGVRVITDRPPPVRPDVARAMEPPPPPRRADDGSPTPLHAEPRVTPPPEVDDDDEAWFGATLEDQAAPEIAPRAPAPSSQRWWVAAALAGWAGFAAGLLAAWAAFG